MDCAAIVPAPINCIFWKDHPWIQDGEDADGVPDADDTVVLRHTVRVTDLSTIEADTFEVANFPLQVGGLAAIQNDSLLVVSGPDSTWTGGVLGVETNGSGSFEVAAGATMRLSDMQITMPFAFETPRMALDEFRNRGTVRVSDASDVGFEVIGPVTNRGSVRGLRALQGTYTQTAEGRIRFDVSGPKQIRDLVVRQGYVTLAGTLEVAFLDGFAPLKGDGFVLIRLDPGFLLTEDALTISPLGLAPGAQFETAFDADAGTYTLTALNDTTSDQPALVSAVLPTSRSVQVGQAATAFATVINTGLKEATDCSIAPGNLPAADFLYQTTDPATNVLTGSPNQPVNIPGSNGSQSFLVALTPTTALDPPTSNSCSIAPTAIRPRRMSV